MKASNRFRYGAVLKVQREFSVDDVKRKLDEMKSCGMNTVVIWPAVYWWESRANRNYPFQTGMDILSYAEEIGMGIIMELAGQITALEYAPDFLMKQEFFAIKANGALDNDKNYFDYLNYNHPEVKMLVKRCFTDIANAYKNYEALYGYDILNETMLSSYDRYTIQLFREWLERKYGTIDHLNDAWDRAYYDWHQIEYSTWLWASVMPYVDWQQFRKANIGMILQEWRGYIKAVDPDRPTIADNINSMIATDGLYDRPHDDWVTAENVDEYGISFYPKENLQGTPAYKRWETFTGIHSAARNGRFWISELQSHHRSMFNPSSIVDPHELKWWNWEAISHGAKGLIYWKWDPFIKGLQTSGRGLVDSKGRPTPRAHVAAEIAGILSHNEHEFTHYEPEQPKVAILYDKLTHDFTKAYTQSVPTESSIYIDSIAGLYECLWELNIPVKFITPENVMEGAAANYAVLFATNQLVMGESLAAALLEYTEQGGILIADGKLGELREDGIMNEDLPGGALNASLGCSLIDIEARDLEITLESKEFGKQNVMQGYFERKVMEIENSNISVSGRYPDGSPAVVCSKVGKGEIVYISTMLWYGYHRNHDANVLTWLKEHDTRLNLSLHSVGNQSLKISTLRGDDGMLVFAFNYHNMEIEAPIYLRGVNNVLKAVTDLCSGQQVEASQSHSEIRLSAKVASRDVSIFKLQWEEIQA